jgi:hypothetical protein
MTKKTNPAPVAPVAVAVAPAIPSISDIVSRAGAARDTAADAARALGRYYLRPLIREDGTIDRKGAEFLKVRGEVEAAYVAVYASRPRTAGHLTVSAETGYDLKRLRDLFALSKGVMRKMAKDDPDYIIATAEKDAVRRDTNRLIKDAEAAVAPPKPKAEPAKPDAAPGAGTAAGDKASKADAAPMTDADILAAIRNFVAGAPDQSAALTFLKSVDSFTSHLRADIKAGRKVEPCEA